MNAEDILKYGHLTVLHTIEGLPEADWETGRVCGVWSVKDIIAHLASYEHILEEVLCGFLGGGPTPYLARNAELGDRFNDMEVAQRHTHPVAQVLAEYNDIQARTMTLIAQIPEPVRRQVGTLPWYGLEYALDDFIVYAYYGHKREHCAQIAVFRDK